MSTALDIVYVRLMQEEGFRARKYRDQKGIETIGYGFNLEVPWSRELCNVILNWWVNDLHKSLSRFYWYAALDEIRRSVIIDVAYNLGIDSLLHFPKMIAAIVAKDWSTAAEELLDSDAARLNKARYLVLAEILKTGVPK